MPSTPGLWAVIPAAVRYDRGLTQTAKLLYAEITSLAQSDGFCWASDAYFAELFDCSVPTISRALRSLRDAGHIWIEKTANAKGTERHIYCGPAPLQGGLIKNDDTLDDMIKNDQTPLIKNDQTPPPTQYKENNKSTNTGARAHAREKLDREIGDLMTTFADGDDELLRALLDFRQARADMKKPFPSYLAAERMLKKLWRLSNGDREIMLLMLDKAIERGWASIYELREDELPSQVSRPVEEAGDAMYWTPGGDDG